MTNSGLATTMRPRQNENMLGWVNILRCLLRLCCCCFMARIRKKMAVKRARCVIYEIEKNWVGFNFYCGGKSG